jgi:hypothetical protein
VTPKGNPLEGVYRNSCCCMDIDVATGDTLPGALAAATRMLSTSQRIIDNISDTGGKVMLNVGWHSSFNTGEEFEPSLLAALGKMKITLGIEVYCDCDEPRNSAIVTHDGCAKLLE